MAEKGVPIASGANDLGKKPEFKESVCIHTQKIYDACRDKDCSRCNFSFSGALSPYRPAKLKSIRLAHGH